ncbi:MAG: LamG-like jellyroll fold domain-containing protein, partial [Planctomycetota bacterium]
MFKRLSFLILFAVLVPLFVSSVAFAPPPPPGQAKNPSPADQATDVSINANLSWGAGPRTDSHDVYFGTSSPGSFQGNQTDTTFEPGTMDNDETYYWRIDEINGSGTTTGNVWSFTTEAGAGPPGQATNPSPANSATDVSLTADLSWTAGSGATSRNVYFGTSSPGDSKGNQTATTYDPGTMDADTTYYWRIDEVNASGTTTGTVWSFTTTSGVDANLIGWWKFDDGEGGTAADSGTGGNNGTVSGALWATGKLDGALNFDGEDDYVSIPNESDFDITTNITVAVWVKLNSQSTENFMSFITKGHESAWALQRAARTGGVSFYLNGLTTWDGLKGTANVFDDKWHHVAGVYDGSRISVYVDGKEDTFLETTGSIGTNNWDVYIGANDEDVTGATGYRYCDGLLDDARVYDRALSDTEIKELAGIDPALAWDPMPTDGAKTVDPNADLEWAAGS